MEETVQLQEDQDAAYHKERIESLQKQMILRDYLAMDRTVLANQRTLLAYFRTFIGLIAAGIGIIKLTDEKVLIIIGWIFVLLSPVVLVVGVIQYRKFRYKYSKELYQ